VVLWSRAITSVVGLHVHLAVFVRTLWAALAEHPLRSLALIGAALVIYLFLGRRPLLVLAAA
jgi:hypothetical protein